MPNVWDHMQVIDAMNTGNTTDIMDPSLDGRFDEASMMTFLSLAISCIDPLTAKRPTMTEVVRALTEAVEQELCFNGRDGSQTNIDDNDANTVEDTIADEEPRTILYSRNNLSGRLLRVNDTDSTILLPR